MTIDTYVQYLFAAIATIGFLLLSGVLCFCSFMAFRAIKDRPEQNDTFLSVSLMAKLKEKDEEIKKLKDELHDAKQQIRGCLSDILYTPSTDLELYRAAIRKIVFERSNKMRL